MLATVVAFITAAAEAVKDENSKVPFYIAGGALAAWAVVVSVIGFSHPDFPSTQGQRSGVMALTVLLVLGAVSTAIITAG
jgi:heme/copper-type cytochrome/quinol oxidase subunit 4